RAVRIAERVDPPVGAVSGAAGKTNDRACRTAGRRGIRGLQLRVVHGRAQTTTAIRERGKSRAMPVFANILQAIGNTPLVRLNKVAGPEDAAVYAKCEYLQPGGSIKDRMAL